MEMGPKDEFKKVRLFENVSESPPCACPPARSSGVLYPVRNSSLLTRVSLGDLLLIGFTFCFIEGKIQYVLYGGIERTGREEVSWSL
jgi:hypothetical protein